MPGNVIVTSRGVRMTMQTFPFHRKIAISLVQFARRSAVVLKIL